MKTWEEKRREEIWEAIEEAPELAHMLVDELLRQEKEQIREIMIELYKQAESEEPDPEGWIMISMSLYKDMINKLLSDRQIKGI
jgi:hypothetical protein